jgi:phosphinothricin acetyltransferase
MNPVTIRTATLADVAGIHAIYSANVLHGTASWELTPPTVAEMQKRMAAVLDARYPYFVAESEGQVVGYTYASAYRPRLGYRYTVENSVYTADHMQRRGIGRRLLEQLIRTCTAQGFRQMIAVIGDSQNIASIRLHQSLGFAQVGLLPNIGFKFDRWLDSVVMQRPLGDGATTSPAAPANSQGKYRA